MTEKGLLNERSLNQRRNFALKFKNLWLDLFQNGSYTTETSDEGFKMTYLISSATFHRKLVA